MSELEISITTEAHEVLEAQRLRFEVFNIEMNRGLRASYERGLDADEFDPYCDHLIVRHRTRREIVGTYRLLRGSEAQKNIGFYSEREFDLGKIKRLNGQILELGRSCARKDFRDKPLIPLMWEAIAAYVKNHNIRYLFGCASLYTTDPAEVAACFSLLKRKYYAGEHLRVEPVPACRFDGLVRDDDISDEQATFLKLPSLVKGYLRLGAVVCGPPALDREFGTADFLLLLDMRNVSKDYLGRFGLLASKVRDAVG